MLLWPQLIAMLTASAYIASGLRLLCFKRNGARVRHGISLLASVLIGALFCAGLEILLYKPAVSPWQCAVAVLICGVIYRSHGNLASVLRSSP
ncbi:phage holin family protein [Pseudomonas sp. 5P_3.1_Bac2]|uniref:phage holin family protein n=1 Tax=Pseudomonas sp. 5P_3.1_Bac2 TaxID=2971617 RepID=UPI0021C74D31|nr:phage holin family protein [Pseudomonas sp. 5P_3.1_Bac2]MCU1717421.1 phage holin family protein [Pseudomonas sp. 5P_3.1_Bac2]